MEINIREMTPGDWPEVARIYRQGMDTNLATFERECPEYSAFDASHARHCRFVAEHDGALMGWAALQPTSSRRAYSGVAELSVYVDERARGQGIGRRLILQLIDQSEKQGYWTLQSTIFQDNAASIRLHEACGFRTVGYRERIARDREGQWRNTLLMERRHPSDFENGRMESNGV